MYQSCSSRSAQPAPNPETWLVEPGRSSVPFSPAGRAKQEVHTHHLVCSALVAAVICLLSAKLFRSDSRTSCHRTWFPAPPPACAVSATHTGAASRPRVAQLCTLKTDCCRQSTPSLYIRFSHFTVLLRLRPSSAALAYSRRCSGQRVCGRACGVLRGGSCCVSWHWRRAEVPRPTSGSRAPPRSGLPNNALTGCCLAAQRSSRALAGAAAVRRAMFYTLEMPAEVELHPRHFGPTMRKTLEDKLTKEVCDISQSTAYSTA